MQLKIILCTIFLVNMSFANTNRFYGFPTREQATYSCPWENHAFSKFRLQVDIVWPWDLLMVIAKAKRIWNWSLLNGIGDSDGINWIRNTISPLNFPVKIVALRTFPVIILMTKRVPLHNLGGFKLRRRIIESTVGRRKQTPKNSKLEFLWVSDS